jgi:hypothetical protein
VPTPTRVATVEGALRCLRRTAAEVVGDGVKGMRWCPRGQHAVPLGNFYANRGSRSGVTVYCKPCTRTYLRERYEARTAGLPLRRWTRRYVVDDLFDAIDSPIKAYVLGVYAADGWVAARTSRIGLEVAAHDEMLITFVRNHVAPGATLTRRTRTRDVHGQARRYSSIALQVTSEHLRVELARHGITPRKSRTLEWPAHLPDAALRPFLLGYFDGDGCATWTQGGSRPRGRQWVLLGTEQFLAGAVAFIVRAAGITLAAPRRFGTRNVFRIACDGRRAVALDAWLHHDLPFGLERKRI